MGASVQVQIFMVCPFGIVKFIGLKMICQGFGTLIVSRMQKKCNSFFGNCKDIWIKIKSQAFLQGRPAKLFLYKFSSKA
jgi:hypothetical protein